MDSFNFEAIIEVKISFNPSIIRSSIRNKKMKEINDKYNNRILGRVLAVEETKAVSGAIEKRPRLTTYEADTYFFSDNPQP